MNRIERVRVELESARRHGEPFGGAWHSALSVAGVDGLERAVLGAQRPVWRAAYYREPLPRCAAVFEVLRDD